MDSGQGGYGVIEGDFRVGMLGVDDGSLELIFTDPLYDSKSTSLYADLAEMAATKPAPVLAVVALGETPEP